MTLLRRMATGAIVAGAIATGSVSVGAVAANAAAGPHSTYSYSHSSSATGWTTTQTWHQYETSTTYDEEQNTTRHNVTGSGYFHHLLKWDRAGKWRQHVTGWSQTAKGAVTWINAWTGN